MDWRNKKILAPLVVIAIAALVFFLLLISKPSAKATLASEKEWPVSVVTVTFKTLTPNLKLYGQVESPRNSVMRAAIDADVIEKKVDEGDAVNKGELLIVLDDSDAKLILQQRQAEVDALSAQIQAEHVRNKANQQALEHEQTLVKLAEREVERREYLYKRKTGSAAELDTAKEDLTQKRLNVTAREREINDHKNRLAQLEAQLSRAKAMAQQATLNVERATIESPFNGRVAKIFVAVGNRVKEGDQLIEVYDRDALEVRAQIPSQYISTIRDALNQITELAASTEVNNIPITFKLDRIAAKVELGRSGVDGLFIVTKNAKYLELGKTISLWLTLTPQKHVIAIPPESLYGLNKVYRVINSRLQGVSVERAGTLTTPDNKHFILVTSSDLKNGDAVITTQLPNAIDGLKVRIVEDQNGLSN